MVYNLSELRLQAFFLVLFLASMTAGVLGAAAYGYPHLLIPESLRLGLEEAVGVTLGGVLLAGLMVKSRWWHRIAGALLFALALYHHYLVLRGTVHLGDGGLSTGRLQPGIQGLFSVSAALLGAVGLVGLEGGFGRRFAFWIGAGGGLLGVLMLAAFAWPIDTAGAAVRNLSLIHALFFLGFGLALVLVARRSSPGRSLPGCKALIVGFVGVVGTYTLALLVGWGSHAERHAIAEAVLQRQATVVRHELNAFGLLIERLANRWAALGMDVPAALGKVELETYFADFPALRALYVVTTTGSPVQAHSRSPGELQWLDDVVAAPAVWGWANTARSSGEGVSWVLPDPDHPFTAVLLVIPRGEHDGLFFASLDIKALLRQDLHLGHEEFHIGIESPWQDENNVASIHQPQWEEYARTTILLDNGPPLHLRATANPPPPISLRGGLATGVFLIGLLVTYFLVMGRNFITLQSHHSRELTAEEERFRSLFFQSPDAAIEFDREGRYQSLNVHAQAITGIAGDMLGVLNYREFLSEEAMSRQDFEIFDAAFSRTLQGHSETFEVTFFNAAREHNIYECAFIPIFIQGAINGVFAVVKDVTERLRSQENQRILKKSLESADSAVMVVDLRPVDMPVVFANAALEAMTGYGADEVLGVGLQRLASPLSGGEDVGRILAAVTAGEAIALTLKGQRRDGAPFWNQIAAVPVKDDSGAVTHFTAIMNDISEKKDQENRLAYQATHDPLTGLGNRSYFEDRLAHAVALARRGTGKLAVLFVDLDHFKPINDTLGHKVGDDVLMMVARRLEDSIRPTDTLARLGGDEFVLLLSNPVSVEEVERVATRILSAVSQPLQIGEHELHISTSIGISLLDDSLEQPERLIQQADMAMYRAKSQGRDTYELYSEDLDAKLSRRLSLRNELQEAIRARQLYLCYQPQVDQTGTFCGLEALVRWRHPEKGVISPAEFIPLAEETGQIIPLGKWVLEQACSDTLRLIEGGLMAGRMSVNISPLQFHRPAFLANIQYLLDSLELPAGFLELEVTEGILMKNSEGALDILGALAGMGVSTAIDDFGTGYSSLGYLKELTVDKVKIDKSFIDHILDSQKDAAVCKGVIALAGELGMAIVAEGVETRAQYERLLEYGCHRFQGYYFARPMEFEALTDWIASNLGNGGDKASPL